MWEKGHVTQEMWRSANVPAQRRLMEIRVALDAWRATPVGSAPYYIRANIPDFHVEVWDGDKLLTRMRTVAGSNERVYNRSRRRWDTPRRTKTFSDSMQYIVFRPYWNIPNGITQNEILPELEKDPEYLTKNRYEWVETSPTNKYLRQLPGEKNALGQVKFLFPNTHDIYMHDTPHKSKFEHPVRAYSHGCVRLKEPMTMAKVLLEHEGRWKPQLVKQYLARDSETWLTLKEQVPVHIDYVVARVDDNGHTHFLADIYTYTRDEVTTHTAQAIAQRMRTTSRALSATLDAATEELAVK
jgi:murein L,D-transpeptidase YcbB/YkuD